MDQNLQNSIENLNSAILDAKNFSQDINASLDNKNLDIVNQKTEELKSVLEKMLGKDADALVGEISKKMEEAINKANSENKEVTLDIKILVQKTHTKKNIIGRMNKKGIEKIKSFLKSKPSFFGKLIEKRELKKLYKEAVNENKIFDAHTEALEDNKIFDAHNEAIKEDINITHKKALEDNNIFDAHNEAIREDINITHEKALEDNNIFDAHTEAIKEDINITHEKALEDNNIFDAHTEAIEEDKTKNVQPVAAEPKVSYAPEHPMNILEGIKQSVQNASLSFKALRLSGYVKTIELSKVASLSINTASHNVSNFTCKVSKEAKEKIKKHWYLSDEKAQVKIDKKTALEEKIEKYKEQIALAKANLEKKEFTPDVDDYVNTIKK